MADKKELRFGGPIQPGTFTRAPGKISTVMRNTRLTFAVVGFVAAATLTACSVPGGYRPADYRIPDGASVELMQTLRFPGRSARVYIQFGQTLRRNDVNEWQPYCSFGLNRDRDGQPLVREVGPTVFTVRKSEVGVEIARNSDDDGPAGSIDDGGIVVAGQLGGGDPGGTPWPYVYYTRMELYSAQQPQVDDLTCEVKGEPPDRNLKVDDIRGALGDIARIP